MYIIHIVFKVIFLYLGIDILHLSFVRGQATGFYWQIIAGFLNILAWKKL